MFELIRTDMKEMVGNYISELLDIELKNHLKRNRYERSASTKIIATVPMTADFALNPSGILILRFSATGKAHISQKSFPAFKDTKYVSRCL